jgi:hypothetical protein
LAKRKRASRRANAQSSQARIRRSQAKPNPPPVVESKVPQNQLSANNRTAPRTSGSTPKTGTAAASKNPAIKLRSWWSNATRWTKAIFSALVGLAAIIAAIPIIVHALQSPANRTPSPAAADANALNSLKAGELFSTFQSSLKTSPTANVWGRAVQIKYSGGTATISDYLFVLQTVYVEAFVGSNDAVDAYTITARRSDMPQGISILGQNYNLGKMTLANAPLPIGVTLVADVCAAHIAAYYEVSGTDEAALDQTVAVGLTGAGSVPSGYRFPSCPFGNTDSLQVVAGAPGYNPESGYYRIEERLPTTAYLSDSLSLRRKMIINAVTITAPGYPVAPEMISLHPQEVAQFSS